MSKAYLAWPVKILCEDEEYHVTAKYIGELDRDYALVLNDINARLKGLDTRLDLSKAEWKPESFNPTTKVMTLHNLPPEPMAVNAALQSLRREDYPSWRPHITMPKSLHDILRQSRNGTDYWVTYVGPLTLYVDKKPVHVFGLCCGCGEARCQGECY